MAAPIRDAEIARDKLADALWWLRGFSAAAETGVDEAAHRLAEELSEVREYINALQHGNVRRLGDEKAIVLTYGEFERLVDASRTGAVREDLADAQRTVHEVLNEYRREAEQARKSNLDLPF